MRHLDEGGLQAWLDHPRSGLGAEEAEAIEGHLAGCEACSAQLEALRASTRRATTLLGTPAPRGAPPFEAIRARAEALAAPAPRRRRWTAATWAASIAVALGAGWMANDLFRRGPVAPATAPADGSASPVGRPLFGDRDALGEAVSADIEMPPPPPATQPAPAGEPAARDAGTPIERADVAEAWVPLSANVTTRALAEPSATAPAPEEAPAARQRVARSEAEATEAVVVRGRVTDAASGRPLESAQVVLRELGAGALTGADGRFTVAFDRDALGATPDDLTLDVRLIGFGEESRRLRWTGADTALDDVRLEATALALQELVVTGGILLRPDDAESEAWTPGPRAAVEAAAGFALRTLPDFEILTVGSRTFADVTVVRVVQALGDGDRLVLFQAARPLAVDAGPDGPGVASARVDDVWVAALAPRPAATLRGWLERIR